ncbi:hypothetical protein [Modestobacter marinus]|uniref:hypothetical protein n=1 Tax=Modestobacter marinus TaxID=477641 RepID=UPI001C972329|nr:hypothetical protein [Modestobacter marinus]
MTSSSCPNCGHVWNLHPGASIWVHACAVCIAEEDEGARDGNDMCFHVPPGPSASRRAVSWSLRTNVGL